MTRHGLLTWGGAVAASVLMLAGCGSDATSSSGAAASAPTTTTGSQAGVASNAPQPGTTSSQSRAGAAKVDACTLISQQEATAALGADPGPAVPHSLHCDYELSGGTFIAVSAQLGNRMSYDTERQLTGGPTPQDVSGVGEAAFVIITADLPDLGTIVFLKSSQVVRISLSKPGAGSSPDAVTTLGKAAAGRL